MNDARFEELTRRAVRKYHSADALHLSPDSFKKGGAGARVKPRMSVLSAAAAVVLMLSFGIFGLLGVKNADDDSLAYTEPETNTALSCSDFNSALSTLRIDDKPVSLPLTIGALCEYADIYNTKQTDGETTLIFRNKGKDDICFEATAESADAGGRVTSLYVCSSYKGADIISIMGICVGDEYGSIVEENFRSAGFTEYIPIDAYRNGLSPIIRRSDGGKVIEAVFFETDEYTATLSGIKIVFGK